MIPAVALMAASTIANWIGSRSEPTAAMLGAALQLLDLIATGIDNVQREVAQVMKEVEALSVHLEEVAVEITVNQDRLNVLSAYENYRLATETFFGRVIEEHWDWTAAGTKFAADCNAILAKLDPIRGRILNDSALGTLAVAICQSLEIELLLRTYIDAVAIKTRIAHYAQYFTQVLSPTGLPAIQQDRQRELDDAIQAASTPDGEFSWWNTARSWGEREPVVAFRGAESNWQASGGFPVPTLGKSMRVSYVFATVQSHTIDNVMYFQIGDAQPEIEGDAFYFTTGDTIQREKYLDIFPSQVGITNTGPQSFASGPSTPELVEKTKNSFKNWTPLLNRITFCSTRVAAVSSLQDVARQALAFGERIKAILDNKTPTPTDAPHAP